MMHPSLRSAVDDLERGGHLRRVAAEIDPRLEAAYLQRRVYAAGGPALLLENVRGCQFPMVCNLFGSLARLRYLFRHTLAGVQQLVAMKVDPGAALRSPTKALSALPAAWRMLPRYVSRGPVLKHATTISKLPQLVSWPRDGGPFVTLPEVYTEDPDAPGWRRSNLGMYRVQLAGNQYAPDRHIGLHYQIHRGIGVHHTAARRRGQPLRVNVLVGGPPALAIAAVMPLPEGLSELSFAGALAGARVRLVKQANGPAVVADADFCISGTVEETLLPEGPFGDHLGYYSLAHDFPVLRVDRVTHRSGAIWPFTSVGRPPQEDTTFGEFIHELTGPVVPTLVPGVRAIHAVDAAGVHPLLLVIGSERYTPYLPTARPQELLTQANALLGQGQLSLAKYLLIVNGDDDPTLDLHDPARFLRHLLARVDWTHDLHFQTCTTIDTLDYSGSSLNAGSKVVIAAAGPPRRELPERIDGELSLPAGFADARLALPGVLCIAAPAYTAEGGHAQAEAFCAAFHAGSAINRFPLVVLVDNAEFAARNLSNWLWVVFTRSNPAVDIHGIESFTEHKHWGCRGALVIDARIKPHHAPPLEDDPAVVGRIESLAVHGGPLHGII
ncbi:MAG: UbiD family decarboxylase [Planctomycetes bacterium]|nr:UbiD family decarboxylase [Planctomycetota bacterium]